MSSSAHHSDYARQQALVSALRDASCFPHPAQTVRLIETHISWVLLAGRYAYKIKKAVDLGFLDFTSLESRRFYCDEEVRLNRRLAPKIYLDVVPIGGRPGQPEFGAQPAIEYAVRMRRFAAARELDHLLEHGKLMPQHMDQLASVVAAFHGGLPGVEMDTEYGTPAAIHAAAGQNFEQLLSMLTADGDRDVVTGLARASEREYAACEKHFNLRRLQGYVRECHGDLHLGNIVLVGERPVPFDGIEFNPAFRWIDVMDEVAFLVMDLLHASRSDLAFRFLNAYLEETGDYAGLAVLRFYLAYRAVVRAKVSAIRASQPGHDLPAQERELAICRGYLELATVCLAEKKPALIITHGLPGSGKSRFARIAAERLGAVRIRSDVERKRLFGMNPLDDSRSGMGDGIYGPVATQRTYARLHELARGLVEAGFTTIVDAAFLRRDEREQFRRLARELGVPLVIASMQAASAELEGRVMRRHAAGGDASEADLAVLRMLQAAQQPLADGERAAAVVFHTDAESGDAQAAGPGWERLTGLLGGLGDWPG